MIVRLLFIALLFVTLARGVSFAHQIPTIVVQAEFHPARQYTLKVNLDPRLFLSRDPTSLPPFPPSWFLDQSPVAQAQTLDQAKAFLGRNLTFKIGNTPLKQEWSVSAVDSISNFPLSPNSSETHLLAEYNGPLPPVPGEFVLTRSNDCHVSLVFLASHDGDAERASQALFEGESSWGIKLDPPASAVPQTPAKGQRATSNLHGSRLSRAWEEYLPMALILGCLALMRWSIAVFGWALFSFVHVLVWSGERAGLLPSAPLWFTWLYWVALVCAILQMAVFRRLDAGLLGAFAAAALCHALAHPLGAGSLWAQSGLLALHQVLGAAIVAAVIFTVKPKAKTAPEKSPQAG